MSRGERKAMITRDAPELSLAVNAAYFRSPVLVLLCAQGGEPFESGADASDRRVVHEVPVLRQPPDGPPVAAGRRLRRPSPGSQVDAIDRPGGDLSGAENQRVPCTGFILIFSKGWLSTSPSGLVRRHHLYPRPACFLYLVAGLGDAPRFILAAVEHHGRWILRRGLGRRAGPLRPAGDGSGQPVSTLLKNGASASPWTVGALHGQHLHRAPVAVSQV